MSDTKISDLNARVHNVIPGRLKSLVLSKRLTVCYAGLSTQALDEIRNLRALNPDTAMAVEFLRQSSSKFLGEIDYLLCSHENPDSPRLVKIKDGCLYEGATQYWIGDSESAADLAKVEVPKADATNILKATHLEESEFTNRFHQYVRNIGGGTVGGAVVNTLCSPRGHCYQPDASVERWGLIVIPNNEDHVVRADIHRTGITSYAFRVSSAMERGVCLVGCYLDQPGVGFIHNPLSNDDAKKVIAKDHVEFERLLRSYECELLGREPNVDG